MHTARLALLAVATTTWSALVITTGSLWSSPFVAPSLVGLAMMTATAAREHPRRPRRRPRPVVAEAPTVAYGLPRPDAKTVPYDREWVALGLIQPDFVDGDLVWRFTEAGLHLARQEHPDPPPAATYWATEEGQERLDKQADLANKARDYRQRRAREGIVEAMTAAVEDRASAGAIVPLVMDLRSTGHISRQEALGALDGQHRMWDEVPVAENVGPLVATSYMRRPCGRCARPTTYRIGDVLGRCPACDDDDEDVALIKSWDGTVIRTTRTVARQQADTMALRWRGTDNTGPR